MPGHLVSKKEGKSLRRLARSAIKAEARGVVSALMEQSVERILSEVLAGVAVDVDGIAVKAAIRDAFKEEVNLEISAVEAAKAEIDMAVRDSIKVTDPRVRVRANAAAEAAVREEIKSVEQEVKAAVEAMMELVVNPVVEEEEFVLIRTNSSTSPLSPSVEGDYDNLGDCEWPLEGLGDFVVINGNGVPMASVSLPTEAAHPAVDAASLKKVATTSSTAPVDKGQEKGLGS
jgi:hypothetical protein